MTDIAGERSRLDVQGLDIIRREAWGARQDYTSTRRVNRPARWLFLHISVTGVPAQTFSAEASAIRVIESIGQQRFGIGCSYNAFSCQSGRLYEGQPLTRRGAHTVNDEGNPLFPDGSLNYDARALCIPQNVGDAVTDDQIDSAAKWGAAVIRAGEAVPGAKWYGHRDVAAKSCPGDKGYARLAELNTLTRRYETDGLEPAPPPSPPDEEEELDMLIVHPASTASYFLFTGDKLVYLPSTTDIRAHQGAGVKTVNVSDRQWAIYRSAYTVVQE
jgi:hypothetical protein